MRFRARAKRAKYLPAPNGLHGDRGRFRIRFAFLPHKVVNGVRDGEPQVWVFWENYLTYQTYSRGWYPFWGHFGRDWVDRYDITTDESEDYAALFVKG